VITPHSKLDVVRSAFEAMERGDIDAWLAHVAPEVRIQRPCGAVASGLEAARSLLEEARTRTLRLVDLTQVHDWVVAAARVPRHRDESNDLAEQPTALAVCRVRDDLIVSVHLVG
jgi:ketosteroid isomerase-like protein